MPLIAGAVLWSAYTLAWFGWSALTDRVPPGPPDHIHWPSIRDLVSPGRMNVAYPPKAASVKVGSSAAAANVQASGGFAMAPGETPQQYLDRLKAAGWPTAAAQAMVNATPKP